MSALPNRFCPQCGTPLAPNALVCSACGRSSPESFSLAPTQVASSAYPETPDPGYSTPGRPPVTPTPLDSSFYGSSFSERSPYGPWSQSYAPASPPVGIQYAVPSAESNRSAVALIRPLGITVLAALVSLQALDDLLSFLVGLSTGNVVGLVVVGVLTIATLALAIGLWRMRPWAFWTAIAVEAIYLLFTFNLAFSTSPAVVIERVILEVIIPLVVLICLFAVRNVRVAIRGK